MSDNVSYLKNQYILQAIELEKMRYGSGGPPGGGDMEARVAKLETHVEYIRRDLDEMKDDLKEVHGDLATIKRRMSYIAGASLVVVVILGWIANNRFEQVIGLLAK